MKAPKKKKEVSEVVEKEVLPIIETTNVVDTFVSSDKTKKAVLKFDKSTSLYEIDFYEGKKKIASESYAFHTRGYHERAAQNYVDGIKKL